MILRRSLHVLLVLISALLIQACGDAADSGDRLRKGHNDRPGTGAGNPNNGVAVDVIVEATPGIVGEVPESSDLESAPKVSKIEVIRIGSNGQKREDNPPPSHGITNHPDGSHTITFSKRYESRLDLAIEATLSNGVTLRRPLPNTARTGPTDNQVPYAINVVTEYAMRSFFDYVEQAEGRARLNELMNCSQLSIECRTQAATSLANLLALAEGANNFEISIPEEYDLEEALEYLETHLDLRRFIEKSSQAVLTRTIGGQTSEGQIPDVLDTVVGNYNGVTFALELNQGVQQPEQPTAVLRNWTSPFSGSLTGDKTAYDAPLLIVANMGFGITSRHLRGVAPSVHNTLTLISGSAPKPSSSPEGELNSIDQTSAYAGYTLEGTYDYGLLQYQSITRETKEDGLNKEMIGWLNNPYFNSLYDATAQGALLSARVTTGLVYRLSGAQAPYKREELREKLNRFTFTAYSKRSEVSPNDSSKGFDPAQLQDRRYGVVMLTQKFNTAGDPVTATGSIRHWQTAPNSFAVEESQPALAADDLDIFSTWTPSYDGSAMSNSPIQTIGREYLALPSRLTKNNQAYHAQTGLLQLMNTSTEESWEGISDPRGELLSFSINTDTDGQGIAHAIPLLTDTGLSHPGNGDTFRLMGNGIGFTSTENYLYHVDNSNLKFTDGEVLLMLNKVRVSQDRTTLEVSGLTEDPEIVRLTATAVEFGTGDIKNSVRMTFTDDAGDLITLEGFITQHDVENPEAGGRIMVLLMRHGNSVGLVYAVLEKGLAQQ